MDTKITVSKHEYESLKRQAAAWRHAVGDVDESVVFNAVRDNEGEGIEAGILAEKLRILIGKN